MRPHATSIAAVCLVVLSLPGCGAVSGERARAQELLEHGDIAQAYWVLTDYCTRNPDDLDARQQLNRMRVPFHITQGQNKVFVDDDWGAVEEFERVLLVEPTNTVAKEWRQKALLKLAERETVLGDDARARGKLEEALAHYQKAMGYVPEFPDAARGSRLVNGVFDARRAKGQDNYLRGVRAGAAGLFEQAAYHLQIALAADPSLDPAREREHLARRHLAEARLMAGRTAEERGWYSSALREYRAVAADFPTLDPQIETRIAFVEREAEVARKVDEALAFLHRKEFVPARELLESAYERSAAQRATISTHLLALREADLEQRYGAALDLELEYRHVDALAAFEAIDAGWPGQLDVRTRIHNLKTAIDLARGAVTRAEAAEAAGQLDIALDAYREALTYAPAFGDVPARVEALRKRIADQQRAGTGEAKPEQAKVDSPKTDG